MSDEISIVTIGGHKVGLIGLDEIFESLKQQNRLDETDLKKQLLQLARDQNYVPDSRVDDYAQALLREYKKFAGLPLETFIETSAFPTVRILGPGCTACETMEKDVKAILTELNIAADVDHIRDINQIAEYGIVRTPSLMINDEIVLNGRSLPKSQLKSLLATKFKE